MNYIDTKEMRERLGTIGPELQTLAKLEAPTEEQRKQFDTLDAEAKSLRDRIKRADTANELTGALSAPDPATAGIGLEDRSGKAEAVPAEPKTRVMEIPDRERPVGSCSYYSRGNAERQEQGYAAGQWLRASIWKNARAAQWCADNGVELRVMTGSDNSKAGALIPSQFMNAIIDLRETYGVFRRESRVVPMSSDTLLVPRRAGGLTMYYINENTAITPSDATFSNVQLTARTLAGLTVVSNAAAEDAVISLADWIADELAYGFALEEDQAGFIGDGTSTYGGIHGAAVKINDGNHAGSILTAATGNTAFSTLDLADFHDVSGKLPEYARPNAKWFISRPGFEASMARLAYAGGGNTVDSLSGGQGLMFLGYPVVISQVLNTTLTADTAAIKLLFGDLRKASTMGDRRMVTVRESEHRYFEFDQTGIVGTQRYDIVNHDLGDGTNAGPLVALKTPAS